MQIPLSNLLFNTNYQTSVSKTLNDLVKGDTFKAEIINIKPDSVSLKLNDGSIIEAKSLVLPEGKIGDTVQMRVKENNDGVIQLEFVKDEQDIPQNFIKAMLDKFELPNTKENAEIIRQIIESELPLDEKSLNVAKFLKYSGAGLSIDKLKFLVEENIPMNKNSAEILNNLIQNKTTLKNDLLNLADEIAKLPDNELKDKIFDLLELEDSDKVFDNKDLNKIIKKINQKLFIKVEKENDLNNVDKKLEKIFEVAQKGQNLTDGKNQDLSKTFQNIKDNIEFTSQISNYKQFLQIPIMIDNKPKECELYIFKNSKGNKLNLKSNASILIGLDFANLGRVETFINKEENNLNFQIRCDKSQALNTIKNNFKKLNDILKNSGYSISAVSFKMIDEPFNVTKNLDDDKKNHDKISKKRFSFDMRI